MDCEYTVLNFSLSFIWCPYSEEGEEERKGKEEGGEAQNYQCMSALKTKILFDMNHSESLFQK